MGIAMGIAKLPSATFLGELNESQTLMTGARQTPPTATHARWCFVNTKRAFNGA